MLVRRKRSNKRKRKFYEAISFTFDDTYDSISKFVGNLGRVYEIHDNILGIILEDGRNIVPNQILLKDDRRERILSFDSTIFYEFYDIWQNT